MQRVITVSSHNENSQLWYSKTKKSLPKVTKKWKTDEIIDKMFLSSTWQIYFLFHKKVRGKNIKNKHFIIKIFWALILHWFLIHQNLIWSIYHDQTSNLDYCLKTTSEPLSKPKNENLLLLQTCSIFAIAAALN